MAQTTGAISQVDYKIEISIDGGSNYTDVSGTVQKLSWAGRERPVSETHTAGTDTPIVLSGFLSAQTVTVESVYSETGGELFAIADSAFTNKTAVLWRASPRGGQSGEKTFTTSSGVVTKCMRPPFDASASTNPVMFTIESVHASTTTATAA